MKKLKAVYPILYLSKQYNVGDELPAFDPNMVKAWTEADTARWVEDEEEIQEVAPVQLPEKENKHDGNDLIEKNSDEVEEKTMGKTPQNEESKTEERRLGRSSGAKKNA